MVSDKAKCGTFRYALLARGGKGQTEQGGEARRHARGTVPGGEGRFRFIGRGDGKTGSGRGLVLYCAIPFLPREVLRNAAREAGVHVYSTDAGDVVRGDSRYFVIHTREGGTRRLRLPRAVVLRDAMTGETVGQGRRISVTLPPDSTTVWEWASR